MANHHGVNEVGNRRVTKSMTKWRKVVKTEQIKKHRYSTDCGLELAHMK